MNQLGNIEKWVVGTVMGLISLLVIYGASASNRVASWVDGPASGRSDLVGLNNSGDRVAQSSGTSNVDPDNMTPLQKAGQLPQRQTVVEQTTQADEIRVQPLDSASSDQAQTGTTQTNTTQTTTTNTTQADPAPTVTQSNQGNDAEPVRALW